MINNPYKAENTRVIDYILKHPMPRQWMPDRDFLESLKDLWLPKECTLKIIGLVSGVFAEINSLELLPPLSEKVYKNREKALNSGDCTYKP